MALEEDRAVSELVYILAIVVAIGSAVAGAMAVCAALVQWAARNI